MAAEGPRLGEEQHTGGRAPGSFLCVSGLSHSLLSWSLGLKASRAWDWRDSVGLQPATRGLLQASLGKTGEGLWPTGSQGPGQSDLQLLLPQVPGGEDQTALSLEECLRLLEATCPFGENAEVSRTAGRAH